MMIRRTLAVAAAALGAGLATSAPATAADDPVVTSTSPGKPARTDGLTGTRVTKDDRGAVQATRAKAAPSGADAAAVRCWNGRRSGRNFYETCRGTGYRPFVDCSNGIRYVSRASFTGTWNHRLTCPVRTVARWGGAYA